MTRTPSIEAMNRYNPENNQLTKNRKGNKIYMVASLLAVIYYGILLLLLQDILNRGGDLVMFLNALSGGSSFFNYLLIFIVTGLIIGISSILSIIISKKLGTKWILSLPLIVILLTLLCILTISFIALYGHGESTKALIGFGYFSFFLILYGIILNGLVSLIATIVLYFIIKKTDKKS